MRRIDSLTNIHSDRPTLLTIGKFDGVHRGHQQLIQMLVERARAIDAQSAVLTFDPHPDEVLRPDRRIQYLTSIEERANLLAGLGIDLLIVLPFDRALSQLSAHAFMQQVCDHVAVRELWVGPNFRLGHRAQGTLDVLGDIGTQLGYTVHPIEWWTLDGETVSSTAIRSMLNEGQVEAAQRYLGRPFLLQGVVQRGDQRGRTLSFPTANIAVPANHVLPADGVYACRIALASDADAPQFSAVANIGIRPTFGLTQRTVEAHILDYDGDLYDQVVRLWFVQRLRGEQRFAGRDELVAQIQRDADHARQVLDNS